MSSGDLAANDGAQAATTTPGGPSSGGGANGEEEDYGSIVDNFHFLSERSLQLFHGLRDLPQFGQKQWQPYFGKTFELYTRLWKFQQQYRGLLEANAGLTRADIGEIASKIGQLYYHYYLRTSETNYLYESYIFYDAIRTRNYFAAEGEESAEIVLKKLRYYARFIVVCLILRKKSTVEELCSELDELIKDYIGTYTPSDGNEWSAVLKEIQSFIEADNSLLVTSEEAEEPPIVLSHRLQAVSYEGESELGKVKLAEAIIVGSCAQQVKFSELTLDMYRMLQSLEREPEMMTKSANEDDRKAGKGGKRTNPHKYLLYRPSLYQLMLYLSVATKETPSRDTAILLYVSGDGALADDNDQNETEAGIPMYTKGSSGAKGGRNVDSLYMEDIVPFTRKPVFIIADSPAGSSFSKLSSLYGAPVVILMSPATLPKGFKEPSSNGNLLTLFLNSPLMALCSMTGMSEVPHATWAKAVEIWEGISKHIFKLFATSEGVSSSFRYFLGEEFLRQFLIRFAFGFVVFRLHKALKEKKEFLPNSHPPMPPTIVCDATLLETITELFSVLDVSLQFAETLTMEVDETLEASHSVDVEEAATSAEDKQDSGEDGAEAEARSSAAGEGEVGEPAAPEEEAAGPAEESEVPPPPEEASTAEEEESTLAPAEEAPEEGAEPAAE
eukprot:Nk52_evm4s859 gene=Nk52_evmTU4s859